MDLNELLDARIPEIPFVCLCVVKRPTREYFAYMKTSADRTAISN